MPKRSEKSRRVLTARGRTKPARLSDRDEIPAITDAMLDRAEFVKDGKIVQRGRPHLGAAAKVQVALRLDPDVLDAYKSGGAGWQTRINDDLRKARKLKRA